MTDLETVRPTPNAPLDGVTVVEIGTFIAGPFAGQQLGDLGADIIKIEQPESGDPMRHWRDFGNGDLWWPSIARNKRSVTMRLSDTRIHQVFLDLIKQADILLENFRPGTLEKWGFGPDLLLQINPRLVITRVSGFGQTGPRSGEPGFGSVAEAMGGIRHLTGWPDRVSTRTGISLGDELAALFAVSGTLAALRHAESYGEGQVVDVAIYEAVFNVMESLVAEYELAGSVRNRTGPLLPGVVPSNAYVSADGDEVIIAANSDAIYARLIEALNITALLDDNSLARHVDRAAHADYIDNLINIETSSLKTHEILEILTNAEIPHGKIYTAADIASDDHFAARDAIRRIEYPGLGDVAMSAPVPKLSNTPGKIRHLGPDLGADTEDVLRTLCGLDRTDIKHLYDVRAI